ncbi:MAG TPA: hypothetical protein VNU94_04195 [Acidobacteriaceae bacterium]|nr:hypothetical protein [Acidobacteriaceae bacterium]
MRVFEPRYTRDAPISAHKTASIGGTRICGIVRYVGWVRDDK